MFGSHLSIAGGMHNALFEAEKLRCHTVQVFTKNQQQWAAKPLEAETIATFRAHAARLKFEKIVAHDSYLINLAAVDPGLREKSIAAFAEELRRCELLGIAYLVTHPGAHMGSGEECGVKCVAESLNRVLESIGPGQTRILLETTAGQGSSLGWRFEHLRDILTNVKQPERFGVCLDTCHVLAAGYDITSEEKTMAVLDEFERIVGINQLRAFHLNDSKKPLGSRVDRHEHIGRGHVGLAAFGVIAQDPRFAEVPKILETPKEGGIGKKSWDEINLEILHTLAAGGVPVLKAVPKARTVPGINHEDTKTRRSGAKNKAHRKKLSEGGK